MGKHLKSERFKRIEKFCLKITFFPALLAIILYYFGFDLQTYFWHVINPTTVIWENFEITVPKELIMKKKNLKGDKKILKIYDVEHPDKVFIFFEPSNCHLRENFDLKQMYSKNGFEVLEKYTSMLLDQPCLFVKSSKTVENKEIYSEDIYFMGENVQISFYGQKSNRFYLKQILDTLSVNEN